MSPPFLLFLKDSREVDLFSDVVRLEGSIEAVDVANGEYEAFDAEGRRLHLTVDSDGLPRIVPGDLEEEAARRLILEFYSENPQFRSAQTLKDLITALSILYDYDRPTSRRKLTDRVTAIWKALAGRRIRRIRE